MSTETEDPMQLFNEPDEEIITRDKEINRLGILVIKLESERNALIQALRIHASEGKQDVIVSSPPR